MAAWILLGIHPYQSKVSVMPFQFRWLEVFGHCISSYELICVSIVFFSYFCCQLEERLLCLESINVKKNCGFGIAIWTKPPLIHETAGLIGPCSLPRLLVFDLGRLVGQPRSKWIRCSVKLKGEPFGSDQMAPSGEGSVETGGETGYQVVNPLHSRLVFGKLPCLQLTVRSCKGKY